MPCTLYSRDEQCQLIMASRQASYCYDKVPKLVSKVGKPSSAPLPGTLYSRDEQCQLIMASHQASYCYDMVPRLVSKVGKHI